MTDTQVLQLWAFTSWSCTGTSKGVCGVRLSSLSGCSPGLKNRYSGPLGILSRKIKRLNNNKKASIGVTMSEDICA